MRVECLSVHADVASGGLVRAVLVLCLLFAAPLEAKTLYVSTTGNDATTYAANGPGNPWRSITRAAFGSTNRDTPNTAEAARAGDTVMVAAGTYVTTGRNDRWLVAYNPVNSGTASAPIVFVADGPVLLTYSSGGGPVIGANGRQFITWRGPFTIDEATAPSRPDTGPVVVSGSSNIVIDGCRIIGDPANTPIDNHAAIYTMEVRDLTIRNCRISGIKGNHNVMNAAGVMFYRTGRVTIEHNEFFDLGTAVSIKAPDYGGVPEFFDWYIVRNNLVHHAVMAVAIHNTGPLTAANPVRVYHNVMHSPIERWGPSGPHPSVGVMWKAFNSDPSIDARFGWVYQNTFVGVSYCLFMNGNTILNAGHRARNNLCAQTTTFAVAWGSTMSTLTPNNFDFDRQLYQGGSFYTGSTLSLASWQALGPDRQSIAADPLFVSATDFRLQASSPARTLGIDTFDLDGDGNTTETIPVGAYVTGTEVIGPITGPVDVLVPPAGVGVPVVR